MPGGLQWRSPFAPVQYNAHTDPMYRKCQSRHCLLQRCRQLSGLGNECMHGRNCSFCLRTLSQELKRQLAMCSSIAATLQKANRFSVCAAATPQNTGYTVVKISFACCKQLRYIMNKASISLRQVEDAALTLMSSASRDCPSADAADFIMKSLIQGLLAAAL